MSTDSDLRQVLAAHARDVEDVPAVTRLGEVHHRVRGVRRRRRTALAGGLAAAVAVVGAVVWLPRLDPAGPAGRRQVAGHTAPSTMTALGYGYAFEGTESGSGSASLTLAASDRPRLVSWAGSRDRVRLQSDLDLDADGATPDVLTPGSADFSDYVYVAPATAARFRVTGPGTVALAVYDLSRVAPGLTQHGVTWRDRVAGATRLGAVTGDRGVTDDSVTVVMPTGGVSFAAFCADAPAGTGFHVTLSGGSQSWGGCVTTGAPYDGLSGSSTVASFQAGHGALSPGRRITARITLERDGKPVPSSRAVLGLGVYTLPPSGGTVGDADVPQEVEEQGHLWRLQGIATSEPGRTVLSTRLAAGATPVLVRTVTSRTPRGYTRTLLDGRVVATSGSASDGGGSSQSVGRLVDRSVLAQVRVGRAGPDTVLGLVTYGQVG